MPNIENVVVAGVTGNLAPAIIQELFRSGRYSVFVFARPDSKPTLSTDYSEASLVPLFKSHKFDAVVSTLNVAIPSAHQAELTLIDLSAKEGVKRFIPSWFGGDNSNPRNIEFLPVFVPKQVAVEKLKALESDTFTWTAIATGVFFDWGLRTGFINVDIKQRKFTVYDEGTVVWDSTNLPTIGRAISNLLSDSSKLSSTSNKVIFITSHTLTQNKLFETVEKVWARLGKPGKWVRETRLTSEFVPKGRAEVAAGDTTALPDLIKASVFGPEAFSDFRGKLSNELLDLPAENLEADIERIIREFDT